MLCGNLWPEANICSASESGSMQQHTCWEEKRLPHQNLCCTSEAFLQNYQENLGVIHRSLAIFTAFEGMTLNLSECKLPE